MNSKHELLQMLEKHKERISIHSVKPEIVDDLSNNDERPSGTFPMQFRGFRSSDNGSTGGFGSMKSKKQDS